MNPESQGHSSFTDPSNIPYSELQEAYEGLTSENADLKFLLQQSQKEARETREENDGLLAECEKHTDTVAWRRIRKLHQDLQSTRQAQQESKSRIENIVSLLSKVFELLALEDAVRYAKLQPVHQVFAIAIDEERRVKRPRHDSNF